MDAPVTSAGVGDSPLKRAWRESFPGWGLRIGSTMAGGALALLYALMKHLSLTSVAIGSLYSLGGLLLAYGYVLTLSYRRVRPILAAERAALDEVRMMINADVTRNGPSPLCFANTMDRWGIPFGQQHIAALRLLDAAGEVRDVDVRPGQEFEP